ncbi:hypothetical protein HELRODRAFT_175481 [Helobdella robusta]|uniref:ILEI/PANDER domain-containing protein n=1 Tax=Helobdella robusta TaxID=6412 RepID=T1F9A9_HELRO|nr:hypothetical protein HELRODRAFT_175481 [Helobdella robusta]ESO00979.1 hypothetical protein HELRODRAFT_175481 [Helobdella robusta]
MPSCTLNEGQEVTKHLKSITTNKIILFATEASRLHLHRGMVKVLQSFGSSMIHKLASNDTYIMVGQKGVHKGSALEKFKKYYQSVIVQMSGCISKYGVGELRFVAPSIISPGYSFIVPLKILNSNDNNVDSNSSNSNNVHSNSSNNNSIIIIDSKISVMVDASRTEMSFYKLTYHSKIYANIKNLTTSFTRSRSSLALPLKTSVEDESFFSSSSSSSSLLTEVEDEETWEKKKEKKENEKGLLPRCSEIISCPKHTFALRVFTGVQNIVKPAVCIDGVLYSSRLFGRGLNVLVYQPHAMQVVRTAHFDTYSTGYTFAHTSAHLRFDNTQHNTADGSALEFFKNVHKDELIIVFTHDDAFYNLKIELKHQLMKFGSYYIHQLRNRNAWLLIGRLNLTLNSPYEYIKFSTYGSYDWSEPVNIKECINKSFVGTLKNNMAAPDVQRLHFCIKHSLNTGLCSSFNVWQKFDVMPLQNERIPSDHQVFHIPIIMFLSAHKSRRHADGGIVEPTLIRCSQVFKLLLPGFFMPSTTFQRTIPQPYVADTLCSLCQ